MSISEWHAFIACVNEMIGIWFSACRLPSGISIWSYYFRLLCTRSQMCAGFVVFSNLCILDINSSQLWKHVCCRVQPHLTSLNDTGQCVKHWRKWSFNVRLSSSFVNTFPSATGQFTGRRCAAVWCRSDSDVGAALLGSWGWPSIHACLVPWVSLCVLGWWWWVVVGDGTLNWRMKGKLLKTGKASILTLVLGCPPVPWVGCAWGLTLRQ